MKFRVLLMVYSICFLVFLLVDLLWLKYLAGPFYRSQLQPLLAEDPLILPALIFYLLFILGNLVFVVIPSTASGSIRELLYRGVLYGLISYGTYDLTNYSTLKEWPLSVTVLDLCWGMAISVLVAATGFYTLRSVT